MLLVLKDFVDGENAIPLMSCQDHKQVGDGDTGPNTSGWDRGVLSCTCLNKRTSVHGHGICNSCHTEMNVSRGMQVFRVLFTGFIIEKKYGLPKLIEYIWRSIVSGELKIFWAYLSYVIQLNLRYWFKKCFLEELALLQGSFLILLPVQI